jgi:hypothetical protein
MAKKAPQALAAATVRPLRIERERGEFRSLVATNVNYFGNIPESKLKPVKKMVGNTTYEELSCVGYNPNLSLLEATVQIKLAGGYGGGLCAGGSIEYVRFFINYGTGWEDAGVAAVNVHDLPNFRDCANRPDKPLTYVITQPLEPRRNRCASPVLPRVRAILSWNWEPPAGDANAGWTPPWGNVLERSIQIKPRRSLVLDLPELIGIDPKIKLPPELEVIQYEPIPLPDPPPFALKQLATMYSGDPKKKGVGGVEPHRFAFAALEPMLGGTINQTMLETETAAFAELGLDIGSLIGALEKTKGNVTYEELNCLGLDYNREWLVGTFVVKKPSGYSGSLCSAGSKEYVTFWADWENTCEWTYVGTASVAVHDIMGMPADGLHYTAVMPVDLASVRRPCREPRIARVRAVLSWGSAPSTSDPEAIPYWGNRVDTHVQIRPTGPLDESAGKIGILGGVGVASIDTAGNGMTLPNAKFALWDTFADPWVPSRQCPFGGLVTVQGAPVAGHKYKLWVQNVTAGSPEMQLTHPVWVTDLNGVSSYHAPGIDGMFDYLPVTQNLGSMLYNHWYTAGDDLWRIRLELYDGGANFLGATPWHRLQLDNTAPSTIASPPTADIHIDSGGDCKDFGSGTMINGHFVARDTHFGAYSINVLPTSMSPNAATPASGVAQTAAFPGDAWSLNTAGMTPCGYVVEVNVWDRSIVNSVPGQHNYNRDDVGFCLRRA